jgi:hypothetical protein
LKYNLVLSDKSFDNLYGIEKNGKTTGLLVLYVLKKWKQNLLETGGLMYDKFCLYLETLSSKISEQIGKPVKKI